MHEIEVEHLMPLDAYESTKENQDPSFLPLSHPDLKQPLHCTDTGSLRHLLLTMSGWGACTWV